MRHKRKRYDGLSTANSLLDPQAENLDLCCKAILTEDQQVTPYQETDKVNWIIVLGPLHETDAYTLDKKEMTRKRPNILLTDTFMFIIDPKRYLAKNW